MTDPAPKPSGCLGFILELFSVTPAKPSQLESDGPLPYRTTQRFLTPAEVSFFHVLRNAVGDEFHIAIKPGLGDIFYIQKGTPKSQSYRNKIDRKHVDFLLCDPKTLKPVLAIELDDKSHDKPDRQARDKFVDRVYEAAELPILHIKAKRAYETSQIENQIHQSIVSQR